MELLIKKRRIEAGLSQDQLGDKCGWDQGRISHYETGRRSPGLNELEAIADALGISFYDLISTDSDEGKTARIGTRKKQGTKELSEIDRLFNGMDELDQKAILLLMKRLQVGADPSLDVKLKGDATTKDNTQ